MDDVALYGPEFHVITFSEAVRKGLLVDYKVIVLAIEESHVSRRLQGLLSDESNQLKVDDAAKIVGCWKALAKQGLTENLIGDEAAMSRAVAFCQVIEPSRGARSHKVSSKNIAGMFQAVVEAYQESESLEDAARLTCKAQHVDGSMNASDKEAKLDWLKNDVPQGTCRILSNVRCLSEGVDVPALDAVLFLTPRNSPIEVVQSVGRVMRKAIGKHRGYVVLPVVIPAGIEPHEALNDNKTYAVVWQVLQALRSHDDRFDAMVNKLDLIGKDTRKMEVIAITDKLQKKQQHHTDKKVGAGGFTLGSTGPRPQPVEQAGLEFEVGEIERAIYAKLVQKVGSRHHWEDWANDIAKIAQTHIDRITGILESPTNGPERLAFDAFAHELRDDLNSSITDAEIVEMLAQHLITKPVFDALFEGYSFGQSNPMSQAMQSVLDVLHEHHLDKEVDTLQAFYESVKQRAEGIDNAAGKQAIVVELYDKFFRNAFPKLTARLGIVYTPLEVVDFILHSVNHLLQKEFGQTLGSKGVHILDPFTGTGSFITRLLHGGLISEEQLPYKYRYEIHANEIVLLAYYIAAINIEAEYHSVVGGGYQPFEGICLTDTFQLYEKEDLLSTLLVDNSTRRKRQKSLDIRVVLGNPPYSAGQNSANDINQNVSYPHLDQRITDTYAARSAMTSVKNLYDSYIRALRWASDRIGNSGLIGFVTNAGFLDSSSADGLRKCLVDEFSSIYVIQLRGNQRTSGELSRKEGGKIFGSGSRAPIAISLLVKNPAAKRHGAIYLYDIGDYLSREEKLARIKALGDLGGITAESGWTEIVPDHHGDWLRQRDEHVGNYIRLGDKKGDVPGLFENFSLGVATGRDAWSYNASRVLLATNMRRMIEFYNGEVARYSTAFKGISKAQRPDVDTFIQIDRKKISWERGLKQKLAQERSLVFDDVNLVKGLYRPFTKQWLFFDRSVNAMVYQVPRLFPYAGAPNRVICLTGIGINKGFSCLMTDAIPDLQTFANGQCFPLYLYDKEAENTTAAKAQDGLFGNEEQAVEDRGHTNRRDAITDLGLSHFQTAYPAVNLTKDDIFYYVYAVLHSPEYRALHADSLIKELPQIPCVRAPQDFWMFSKAGRCLAELHLGYEAVALYPLVIDGGDAVLSDVDLRIEKMHFGSGRDLTTVHYNHKITLRGIPLEAHEYVVNGKSAVEWVVERQRIHTDKETGIINDSNVWATETMKNPRYPLELLQRVITVSLETLKIMRTLPVLDI